MQTPVQIDCKGLAADMRVKARTHIQALIGKLELRYGRVTSCRALIKGPGAHHRGGGQYDVNIRLALPAGRLVNVGHTAKADARHADLDYAINDAFKRARRQLQDQVRRLQGQLKQNAAPPTGTVTSLDPTGEFGFLQTDDGREIYFHKNSIIGRGVKSLKVGSKVLFAEGKGDKGPKATTVRLLQKHMLRV
ncbi:MAG: cold shock domain-containing protein [Pseudorhodoplanes sp.]|nr:cold shock domain-containing protein [Pseudorhodoplanes sp.]